MGVLLDAPLLQGSRQGSPLDSKRVRSFALTRLALGNYPWLYDMVHCFGRVLAFTATMTRAGITAIVCRLMLVIVNEHRGTS
jgi:hypothetical protein